MRYRTSVIVFAILCLTAATITATPKIATAAELAGISMPDSVNIAGKDCALVGQGLRKVLFIKIYVSGLYMETPLQQADEVIDSDQVKRLVVHWKYKKVSTKKLQKEYREKIDENTPERSEELNRKIDHFISLFTKPAVKDAQFIYTYEPGKGTSIFLSGEDKGFIEGRDFMKALFKVWFGEKPFDKHLKKGLLGG
ncbi:MAG TPA: hypothetical protein ENH32_08560 [Proteobacteria bacterium]|nr:chalcone-flavanone isomerase [bacterium BMS3Abin14]HDL54012.1 hypothetical protein [Pseudomonadota bacterium]